MLSTSGRSSRSTLMLTHSSFITAATVGSSNDSCAITWHQWHAEYPTLNSTGLSSVLARSNASSPHGYQSTGLSLCCRRYGLVSSASRFMVPSYPHENRVRYPLKIPGNPQVVPLYFHMPSRRYSCQPKADAGKAAEGRSRKVEAGSGGQKRL